jgi:hypothetical protein
LVHYHHFRLVHSPEELMSPRHPAQTHHPYQDLRSVALIQMTVPIQMVCYHWKIHRSAAHPKLEAASLVASQGVPGRSVETESAAGIYCVVWEKVCQTGGERPLA